MLESAVSEASVLLCQAPSMRAWRKACFQQRAMAPEPWDIAWADTGCGCPIVVAIASILGGFDDALLVKR